MAALRIFWKKEFFSQTDRLLHLLWQPSTLGGNFTMGSPFLHPSKKVFLSPSVWSRREHTWTFNWKKSLLICFENFPDVPYSHKNECDDEHFFVISLRLWIKLPMGRLLLFFLCEFSSLFSYIGGVLVTNLFSTFIDW